MKELYPRYNWLLSTRNESSEWPPESVSPLQEAIYERYGIPSDQLRVYVHYQPSYYHLHVHFTQLSYNAPKSSVGDAHLLRDIIANIETFDPEFYQKCRLSFTVSESCLLWKAYQNYSSAPDQIASSCL